jgi:TolB-like protein/Tfp pilus assembly protein PilF
MAALLLLLERKGQLVTREQIIERIWGQDVFHDTDNSINGAIRKIRQVLKDDPEKPRFVQTVTGKGYRFVAQVVEHIEEEEAGVLPAAVEAVPPAIQKPLPRRWPVFAAITAVLVVATAMIYFLPGRNAAPAPKRVMLAVLPFKNLTGDPGQDYFSEGLTEEMIAQLGRLDPQQLGVIARTSATHYKDTTEPLSQIANELGVQYVLEGSVRRDTHDVRVTAQLIQASDQTHLWAKQYDREPGSILTLQAEIAQEISDEIQLTLGKAEHKTVAVQKLNSPNTYEAYDLYLKGRYFWNRRTVEDFQQAIKCFEQAVHVDPTYARAYAGLADSYALLGGYSGYPQKQFMLKARAAALQALHLDNNLAEAHVSLALIAQNYDWDWKTAEQEYRQAIRLDPNYATAHHWFAEFLSYQGRFDESFEEVERARLLDPLSLIIATDKGAIFYYSRQYDRAIAQLQSVLDMDPNFQRARMIIFPYVEAGQPAKGLEEIQSWPRPDDDPWKLMLKTYVYTRLGQDRNAKVSLNMLEKLTRERHLDPAPLVSAYVAAGDKQQAFTWLEKSYSERSTILTTLKVNPFYDPLRNDRRFADLEHRVGLTE